MKALLFILVLLANISAKNLENEKKLILIVVEMELCPWCHEMNKETFDDASSLKKLKEHFLIAKIKRESGDIPLFLEPKYFPTTYVLSWDGAKVIDELPGYMKKNSYLDYLETLYEVENDIE